MGYYKKNETLVIKELLRKIFGRENLIEGGDGFLCKVKEPLMYVEYHGIQHYIDGCTLRETYDFVAIQEEDKRKREYCELHNIPLLVILSSEKNFLGLGYLKWRIDYVLGRVEWFGEKF